MLIRARLIKTNTDDGLLPLTDDVSIGDVFLIDMDTREKVLLFNEDCHKTHEKELVQNAEDGTWLPMECLQIFI